MLINYAAVLLAIAVGAPAVAADTFDLVCIGTVKDTSHRKPIPVKTRFTVDLTRRLWCKSTEYGGASDHCPLVKPIIEITPDRITFFISESGADSATYVNRLDGTYSNYARNPFIVEAGTCEVSDFSGFPSSKF